MKRFVHCNTDTVYLVNKLLSLLDGYIHFLCYQSLIFLKRVAECVIGSQM